MRVPRSPTWSGRSNSRTAAASRCGGRGEPRRFAPRRRVVSPARVTSVLAVGATTITGCQAEYSNAGNDLDLMAPGGGPDVASSRGVWDAAHCNRNSVGRPIVQETFKDERLVQQFGFPRDYEGTSMATRMSPRSHACDRQNGWAAPGPGDLERISRHGRRRRRPDRYGPGLVARRPLCARCSGLSTLQGACCETFRHAAEHKALGAGHSLLPRRLGRVLLSGYVEDASAGSPSARESRSDAVSRVRPPHFRAYRYVLARIDHPLRYPASLAPA